MIALAEDQGAFALAKGPDYQNSGSDESFPGVRARDFYVEPTRTDRTGLLTALVALVVVSMGVAAYLYFNGTPAGSETQDSVARAQQSVADAIARVDSLPKDHPLRGYLPGLEEWQGELRAYGQTRDPAEQIRATADQYKLKADQISGQARVAMSALARQANQNSTAQPVPEGTSTLRPADRSEPEDRRGTANREQGSGAPGRPVNANRGEAPHEPTPRPQPSSARPENSNTGLK